MRDLVDHIKTTVEIRRFKKYPAKANEMKSYKGCNDIIETAVIDFFTRCLRVAGGIDLSQGPRQVATSSGVQFVEVLAAD